MTTGKTEEKVVSWDEMDKEERVQQLLRSIKAMMPEYLKVTLGSHHKGSRSVVPKDPPND